MSKLRPECGTSTEASLPKETLLYMIALAVGKRRSLIYGKLDDKKGRHCAMGCFWDDNPSLSVPTDMVDEIAAVNDSIPPTATPKERWKYVQSWLRFKLKVLTSRSK